MRSDYVLYAVAIICFIITGTVAAYAATQQLWIVIPAVVGLAFIGVGYTQRPRQQAGATQMAISTPPPPPTMTTPKVAEVTPETKTQEKIEPQPAPIAEVKKVTHDLLEVKGIKDKRALQLKAVGINSVEDLAKASPEELASKLKIAPYFTGKWIENAKAIVEKT
jgi:predicted flap endonuclease-1-like 5' DNA nuclease